MWIPADLGNFSHFIILLLFFVFSCFVLFFVSYLIIDTFILNLAGRVVGKKGVVITNIERETRSKLVNALSPVGSSLWIAVVIIGDFRSICSAYKAVSDIVLGGTTFFTVLIVSYQDFRG